MNLSEWTERFKNWWSDRSGDGIDGDDIFFLRREKIIVFLISFVLALCMWLLVNLNREFNLNVNLPLVLGNQPENMALANDLPEYVTVSINGGGWKLINVINNPPQIYLDVRRGEINLYDQVREQLNAVPDVSVLRVQPNIIQVELEERETKRVPVEQRVQIKFASRRNYVGQPEVTPDSVTISGAASHIVEVDSWPTVQQTLDDVRADVNMELPLKPSGDLIQLSTQTVTYSAHVAEYTEGEVDVYVKTKNLPEGQRVTYSPSMVTIKYNVPLSEYAQSQESAPFEAFVPYQNILQDTTGFVEPVIQPVSDNLHVEVHSFHPRRLSYFHVIESGQ